MSKQVKEGSTNVSIRLRIIDSSDGTPETGVTSATSGLDLWYQKEGAAKVSLTESDLSALTDAHSDGGILHISDGYYRVDVPDAAFTGADSVIVGGTVTGMIVIGNEIQIVEYDPNDAVRLGLTALPNAAADAAGGLPISDAGGLDLDTQLANAVPTVAAIADAVLDEALTGHNTAGTLGRAVRQLLEAMISVEASVSDAGPTTTDFDTDLTETTTDFYADCEVVFISGNNTGIGRVCTAYNGTTKNLTFDEAFPESVADTDSFIILAKHTHSLTQVKEAARAEMDANSTQLAAIVADTQDLQTQVGTAGAGLTDLGGMSTGMKAEVNAECDTAISDAALATAASITALNDVSVSDILTTQMTESYAADGTAPTIAQALMMIQQKIGEFAISGTTLTVKQLDGSTTAATFTLDDATSPTSITRAS